MIDLEKHAYMLQCYKCYKCYKHCIFCPGQNVFTIVGKRLDDSIPSSSRLPIIGKLVEKLPIILFPTFASLTKCTT